MVWIWVFSKYSPINDTLAASHSAHGGASNPVPCFEKGNMGIIYYISQKATPPPRLN